MIRQLIAAFATATTLLVAAIAPNAYAEVEANRASQAELETVKGIGPGLSAKIVKAREAGAFKGWADMVERVPGVGAGNAAKMSTAGLTVGGTAFDPSKLPATEGKKKAGSKAADADKAETAPKANKAQRNTKADSAAI
ncbi:MAG: helix-hairpin-helix domain-containing protein [Rubrivivax sp.]|jgi:competence protein ComEA|nr:helix-hairpin-helix domain-containing protein [Rubrivivax sp.]